MIPCKCHLSSNRKCKTITVSNLCGNTFINVRLHHRKTSQVNFLLLCTLVFHSDVLICHLFSFLWAFVESLSQLKTRLNYRSDSERETKTSFFCVCFDPFENVSNYTQTSLFTSASLSFTNRHSFLLHRSIAATFSTSHSVLLQFDSV